MFSLNDQEVMAIANTVDISQDGNISVYEFQAIMDNH